MKAIKPKKVVRQILFKNHLKFQNFIFNKVFTVTWANAATKIRKVLENIFTQKLL